MSYVTQIEAELTTNYAKYYRMAYSYLGNESDALDAVQEGAYKAIKNADKLRELGFISTWIGKIMINEALTILRARKKVAPLLDDENTPEIEGAPDEYEDIDLKSAIDGLDLADQLIIKLRFFQDLPLKEIADILDTNENTVKSRLYRTLGKLKIKMEEA